MTLNLPLLFVFQLAARQLFFWHRENLLHRVSEFLGRLPFGRCRHRKHYARLCTAATTVFLTKVRLIFFGHLYKHFWRRRRINFGIIHVSEESIKSANEVCGYRSTLATGNCKS